MKRIIMGLYVVAVLFAGVGFVQATLHEFTLKDGRTLKAEIVSYNAKLKKVELKREDGKLIPVNPAVFTEADQSYIMAWASLDGVRSERFFKVTCEKDLVEKWKKEEMDDVMYDGGDMVKELVSVSKFQRYIYNLTLENKNTFPLENLKLEYRVFYGQEEDAGSSKVVEQEKVVSGSLNIKRVASGKKTELKTDSVVLRDTQYSTSISYGSSATTRSRESGELKGIWVRIMATGPDGQTVVRDIFEPSSLEGKHKWPESQGKKSRKRKS